MLCFTFVAVMLQGWQGWWTDGFYDQTVFRWRNSSFIIPISGKGQTWMATNKFNLRVWDQNFLPTLLNELVPKPQKNPRSSCRPEHGLTRVLIVLLILPRFYQVLLLFWTDPAWGFPRVPYEDTCIWILQISVYNYTLGNYDCLTTFSGHVCEIRLP